MIKHEEQEKLYSRLHESKNFFNYNSIISIFTSNIGNYQLDKSDFIQGLKRIGYSDDEDTITRIVKSYENKYNSDKIFFQILDSEYSEWLEKRDSERIKLEEKEKMEQKKQELLKQFKDSEVSKQQSDIVASKQQQQNVFSFRDQEDGPRFKYLEDKLMNELKTNEKFVITCIYKEIKEKFNQHSSIITDTLKSFDPMNKGFISKTDFEYYFDEIGLILSDDEKQLILGELSMNASGMYLYEDFLHKVKNFKLEDINFQIKNYHFCYNDYIVRLRKYLKETKRDVVDLWKDSFGNTMTKVEIGFDDFLILMNKAGFTKLDNEEYSYLFSKLADGNIIKFMEFKYLIKLEPPEPEYLKTSNYFNIRSQRGISNKSVNFIEVNKNTQNLTGQPQASNVQPQNSNVSSTINSNNNIINANSSIVTKNDVFETTKFISNPNSNVFNNQQLQANNIEKSKVQSEVSSPTKPTTKKAFPKILNIRDPQFELQVQKSINDYERKNLIQQRINQVEQKVMNLVRKNPKFLLYEGLEILLQSLSRYNKDNVLAYFYRKYMNYHDKKIPENEFGVTITELIGMNPLFKRDHLISILKVINNKSLTTYSYEEFIEIVFMYKYTDKLMLFKKYQINLNDFVLDLKQHFINKNMSIIDTWKKMFADHTTIIFDYFIQYLNFNEYKLIDPIEYMYVFNLISLDGVQIRLDTFTEIIKSDILSEEDLLNEANSTNSNAIWKNNLENYDDKNCAIHQQKYQKLYNIFKLIKEKALAEGFKDIINIFNDVNIQSNGECLETEFASKLGKIKMNMKDSNIMLLLNSFKGKTPQTTNIISFLNGYYSFYWKDRIISKEKEEAKIEVKVKEEEVVKVKEEEKKAKTSFNQDEIDYISEFINYSVEIILDEMGKDVEVFFKENLSNKDNFSKSDIQHILEDVLSIQTDEQTSIFLDYLLIDHIDLAKVNNFITLERIVQVYKKYSQKGILYKAPSKKSSFLSTNTKQNIQNNTAKPIPLSKEEELLKEFAEYLKLKRIPWKSLFPYQSNSSQISYIDFESCFTISKFKLSKQEIEMLIKYIDPDSKKYISSDVFKNYIKKHQRDYFELPFQDDTKIIQQTTSNEKKEVIKKGLSNAGLLSQPKLIDLINKMNDFIIKSKFSISDLFSFFNKNGNDKIELTEFVQMIKKIDKNVNLEDIGLLFSFIDKDESKFIQLNELKSILIPYQPSHEERVKNLILDKKIIEEINELFDKFDINKDNKISQNELYTIIKSINHNTTMEDIAIIMKKTDKDKNSYIDRKEFTEIMEEKFKVEMAIDQEEKNYMIRLFQEEDIDKVGFLTVKQTKHLLIEKLKVEYGYESKEIDELINAVDSNYDGKIDINEFINMLEKNLSHEHSNSNVQNTIRKIKLTRKINPNTFLSIFKGLPLHFTPSFLREEQKLLKNLPSSTLYPTTEYNNILFKDIKPSGNKSNNKFDLAEIQTSVCCKITFDSANGVPIPDESKVNRDSEIVARVLKICLFNKKTKRFIGNCITVECSWSKESEDMWNFEKDNKKLNHNIILRHQDIESGLEDVVIVFEFVIYLKKSDVITELNCGWSSLDLSIMRASGDFKLPIKGGSPMKTEVIDEQDIRAKRTGMINKIFSQKKPASYLPIKVKEYKDLNKADKLEINYLPSTIILHKTAIHLCSTYRKLIASFILNDQNYNTKKIDLPMNIIVPFTKIVNSHEAFKTLVEIWNPVIAEDSMSKLKSDPEYLNKNLKSFINEVYSVIQSDKFQYTEMDPSFIPLGNIDLIRLRSKLVNNVLKLNNTNKIKIEANIQKVEEITRFKPFNISEYKTNKISLLSSISNTYNNPKIAKFYLTGNEDKESIITESRYNN